MKVEDLTREEKIIMWAHQWAEHIDDEEMIKLWREKVDFKDIFFNGEWFDLEEVKA